MNPDLLRPWTIGVLFVGLAALPGVGYLFGRSLKKPQYWIGNLIIKPGRERLVGLFFLAVAVLWLSTLAAIVAGASYSVTLVVVLAAPALLAAAAFDFTKVREDRRQMLEERKRRRR